MANVTVLALIKAKSSMEEAVRQELEALLEPTRAEQGCVEYRLHSDPQDGSRFMFYENWRTKEDLDRHLASPHLTALLEKAEELFDGPLDVTIWQEKA